MHPFAHKKKRVLELDYYIYCMSKNISDPFCYKIGQPMLVYKCNNSQKLCFFLMKLLSQLFYEIAQYVLTACLVIVLLLFFFVQIAIGSLKEICGLGPIVSLSQCIQTLASRLLNGDNISVVTLNMKNGYPYLEPLGTLNDVQRKVLSSYDLVGMLFCNMQTNYCFTHFKILNTGFCL